MLSPLAGPALKSSLSGNTWKFDVFFKSGGETVSNVAILLHFTYYVKYTVKTQFKAIVPIFVNAQSGGSISEALLTGQMRIQQDAPLEIGDGLADTLYNLNFTEEMLKYSPAEIFDTFTARNNTLKYDYKAIVMPFGDNQNTHIEIELQIPEYETVLYIPGFFEGLKNVWVQFFALMVPIYIMLYMCLLGYGIETRSFPTVLKNDLPKDESKMYLYN